MLQCGHSYCATCLLDFVSVVQRQRNCFECPLCRHPHEMPEGSSATEVIRALNSDTVSLSILSALGIQDHSQENEYYEQVQMTQSSKHDETKDENSESIFCVCARHQTKPLDVYCSRHDIVVCSDCAAVDHNDQECDCTSARNVIKKRFNAIRCLAAQQSSDASRLFSSSNTDVKTVKSIYDDFQKSVTEVEESFSEVHRIFRRRVDSMRRKAKETVEKDKSCADVRSLQEILVEKVKSFSTETEGSNPNKMLKTISEMCRMSSELQMNMHELSEKVKSGGLLKYAEGDLNVLDAYVSTVKQTLPDEFLSLDDIDNIEPDDKDFVIVTSSGSFLDAADNECDSSDVSQQITFSAKGQDEDKCMLSGVSLIGNTAAVVVDQYNRKLKKFKLPEGRFLNELKLEDEPHQVTTLRESSEVAVTLWDVPKVLVVATDPTLNVLRVIDTDTEYIGITSYVADTVAAASIQCRRVDVLHTQNLPGNRVKKRETIFQSSRRRSFPDRLAASADGRVIVRNRRRHEVCCFSRQALIWSRRLKTQISDITCFRGKVFASLRDKNDIISFRDDGQGPVDHLKQRQPVFHPWALDGFKDCLVVTEDSPSDLVHIFVFA